MNKALKRLIAYKNGKRNYPILERWRIIKDIIEVLVELDKRVDDNWCAHQYLEDAFKSDGVDDIKVE